MVDHLALSLVCLDSARVWLSCQAIKWISVLAGLCRVLANPVTYYKGGQVTKSIILVEVCYKLYNILYVIQVV